VSLYDDLGVEISDSKTEGWSKNFKLLQSRFQVKKAALTQAKSQRTKQSPVPAPVIDLKREGCSDDRQIVDTPPHVAAGLKDPVSCGFSAETQILMKMKTTSERERRKRSMGGAAMAPSTSLVEKDKELPLDFPYEEVSRPPSQSSKAAIPPPVCEEPDTPRSPTGPSNTFLVNMGGTVVHKIMQKYGFREGQGLGKHEQGLSKALSVEKTSKLGGKNIVGDATGRAIGFKSFPTKVVLLWNTVGAGEVDEHLEVETKEECEKYGKIGKYVISEIPGAPDDEAVRMFLEFERVVSAIKAVVDLNGRYSGGRVVKACFHNLDKFRVLDLVEQV
uniref:Splicing factor 45 n=1 Tax=Nannospalax galili TaxID=1026970 RepID=A0A8C6Q9V7_NANGA